MKKEWEQLYASARKVIQPHEVSEHLYVGSVGAAVLTKGGNIYTGICMDMRCSLGMCAERNALSTMLTNGEYEVAKVCCIRTAMSCPPAGPAESL